MRLCFVIGRSCFNRENIKQIEICTYFEYGCPIKLIPKNRKLQCSYAFFWTLFWRIWRATYLRRPRKLTVLDKHGIADVASDVALCSEIEIALQIKRFTWNHSKHNLQLSNNKNEHKMNVWCSTGTNWSQCCQPVEINIGS